MDIYLFDNNKDMEYAASASMTVKLSENFEVISKTPNYSSKDEYISSIKLTMIIVSISNSGLLIMILLLAGLFAVVIAEEISKAKKKKNTSNEPGSD